MRLTIDSTPSEAAADGGLVKRCFEGDRDAFANLYARYWKRLYLACLKQLGDHDLAQDAAQDAFVKAFTKLERFDTNRSMLPWLITIAHRRCIDLQRRGSKTSVREVSDHELSPRTSNDETADAVIAAQERKELQDALATLPWRQRRALLLFAVEGWSYSEIAATQGATLSSTKTLLFRARTRLREACSQPMLGVLLMPIALVRRGFVRLRDEIRTHTPALTDLGLGTVHSLGAAALAFSIGVAGMGGAAASNPLEDVTSLAMVGRALPLDGPSPHGTGAAARMDDRMSGRPLSDQVLDPTGDATPERTQFDTIVVSPRYEQDHTVLAAGKVQCVHQSCRVLFISRDGGASWQRLTATGFAGTKLMLPANYPGDGRIFSMGPAGLQVSQDGGASFLDLIPITGEAAISPAFGRGDDRILIGTSAILEYGWQAGQAVLKPAVLASAGGVRRTVAFDPSFLNSRIVMIGGAEPDASGELTRSLVHVCQDAICSTAVLEGAVGIPSLRLSPRFPADGSTFAFTSEGLYASATGGRTFTKLNLPLGLGSIFDATAGKRAGSLLVAIGQGSHPLLRSSDRGHTWETVSIDVAGFTDGSRLIVSLPDGRVLAGGVRGGIACSLDGGSNWSIGC